jgi:hypothetical protein
MACPIVLGDAAFGLAGNAFERAQSFAGAAFSTAMNAVNTLTAYTIDPVTLNASFNFTGDVSGMSVPPPPEIDASAFRMDPLPNVPEAPDTNLSVPGIGAVPTFTASMPELMFPGNPQLIDLTHPGQPPDIDWAVQLAQRPDFVLPPVPTLQALNLPTPPTITIPAYDVQRPDVEIPMPSDDFNWSPATYVERMMANVVERVNAMLAGEPLPAAVAAALRARAFAAADIEETRAVQQAWDEHASRGFEEPTGLLNRRLAEARQGARNARQALNRDVFIQEQLAAREDVRTAIAQGIAGEAMLSQLHINTQQLSLDAAKYAVEVAISILNARIARLNALVALYEADARVYRERIQAELAKVEIYRAELEAQRLVGDINRQTLELYLAQLSGIRALIDNYVAQNQGVRIELDAKLAQLQGFRERVTLMVEQLRGQQMQWEGVRVRGDIEVNKVRAFEALSGAFASRVQAFSTVEGAKSDRARLQLDANGQNLEKWQGLLRQLETLLRKEEVRMNAGRQHIDARVSVYRGQVDAENVRSQANERRLRLRLAEADARVNVDLRRGDQSIEQMRHITTIYTNGQATTAQVMGSLAASAMSAANASASVSAGASQSRSCDENYVYTESSNG